MKNIIHWCKPKKCGLHTHISLVQNLLGFLLLEIGEVETKPNKKDNPRGWIKTDHTNVIVNPSEAELQNMEKCGRLIYDKQNVKFNLEKGEHLLFDEEGCFLVKYKQSKEVMK